MKTTTYYTNEIPAGTDNDFWVHFIYSDDSGWVGVKYENDEEEDNPVEICTQIVTQMETESLLAENIPLEEIQADIEGYSYHYHTEIDGLNIVKATPYRGEETLFIWEY